MHVLEVIGIAVMWLVWESAVRPALGGRVDMPTAISVQLDLPLRTISQPATSWLQCLPVLGTDLLGRSSFHSRSPLLPTRPSRCWVRWMVSRGPEVSSAPLW